MASVRTGTTGTSYLRSSERDESQDLDPGSEFMGGSVLPGSRAPLSSAPPAGGPRGEAGDGMEEVYQVIVPPMERCWYADMAESPLMSLVANLLLLLLLSYLLLSLYETHRGVQVAPDAYQLLCGLFDGK